MEGKSFPKARRLGREVLSAAHADDRRMLGALFILFLCYPAWPSGVLTHVGEEYSVGKADAQSNALIQ